MIVIADSGSTKCNWQLVDDSGSVRRVQSRGINAVLQRPDEVEALLRETFAEPVQADALHFYGAGCGERYPEQSARLREALARYFPAARIAVESDLMGAARALLGGRAGIACILGTGSNSCYYDGVRIVRNTPPLGWVLGDEGSGTYIGRQLVGNLLKGLCDESLRRLFFEEERLDYDEIIRRVYREGMANRFLASFTRFVARHIDRPELDELVCEAFRAFVRRNLAHYPADAEVSALGGVACHFERQLRHVLATEGLRAGRIVETPDEGLLNYQYGTDQSNGTGFGLRRFAADVGARPADGHQPRRPPCGRCRGRDHSHDGTTRRADRRADAARRTNVLHRCGHVGPFGRDRRLGAASDLRGTFRHGHRADRRRRRATGDCR